MVCGSEKVRIHSLRVTSEYDDGFSSEGKWRMNEVSATSTVPAAIGLPTSGGKKKRSRRFASVASRGEPGRA